MGRHVTPDAVVRPAVATDGPVDLHRPVPSGYVRSLSAC